MSDVTLVLDNRERALAEELTDEPFTSVPLDCGDIQVCVDGVPLVVLERKTLPDLAQSIKDGRYREQKVRLLSSRSDRKIGYLFEGVSWTWDPSEADAKVDGLTRGTLQTAIINCMFRDDIGVVFTKSTKDTADFVRQLLQRVRKHPEAYASGGTSITTDAATPGGYSQFLNVCAKKSANMTPATSFVMQIRQIPGIAEKAATAICGSWSSMADLCATADRAALAGVRLGGESGRKLGPKLADRVCTYLGLPEQV